MYCVNCGKSMVSKIHYGIQIQHCPSCDTLWLDHNELRQFVYGIASSSGQLDYESFVAKSNPHSFSRQECPRCSGYKLRKVETDLYTCTRCKGVSISRSKLEQYSSNDLIWRRIIRWVKRKVRRLKPMELTKEIK